MNKAFKFRIYPNAEQRVLIGKTFGCARFIYNRMQLLSGSGHRVSKIQEQAQEPQELYDQPCKWEYRIKRRLSEAAKAGQAQDQAAQADPGRIYTQIGNCKPNAFGQISCIHPIRVL